MFHVKHFKIFLPKIPWRRLLDIADDQLQIHPFQVPVNPLLCVLVEFGMKVIDQQDDPFAGFLTDQFQRRHQ